MKEIKKTVTLEDGSTIEVTEYPEIAVVTVDGGENLQ